MRRILSILGGLALGIVLSQFPEYAQQYTQRLGGAVDELRIIIEDFDRDATAAGLTREEALARYAGTEDAFIVDRGLSMAETLARYEQLSAMLARIQGADALERFTLLPDFLDTEIGARALQNFRPAVPVTVEGFAYGGGGFLLGYLVLSAIVSFLMLPFRPRRHRAPPARAQAAPTVPPPPPQVQQPAAAPPARKFSPPPDPAVKPPAPAVVRRPDPAEVKRAVEELTMRQRRTPAPPKGI